MAIALEKRAFVDHSIAVVNFSAALPFAVDKIAFVSRSVGKLLNTLPAEHVVHPLAFHDTAVRAFKPTRSVPSALEK